MSTESSTDPNYGLCQCGCGQKTWVPKKTYSARGWAKGVPVPFKKGHNIGTPRIREDARPFKIDGVYCRLVPLTRGLYSIVDANDYDWLMQKKWSARPGRYTHYAHTGISNDGGVRLLGMHRLILGITDPQFVADHINGNGLDNRRGNLRVATATENSWNTRRRSNNTSGHRGIYFNKFQNKWIGRIKANGKNVLVAKCDTIEEAIPLYNNALLELRGEFANHG